jgi:hypothetical protein
MCQLELLSQHNITSRLLHVYNQYLQDDIIRDNIIRSYLHIKKFIFEKLDCHLEWEILLTILGDKFAIDCHGHVHFHLKLETFYSLIESNENWKEPLCGRNCNPNDYKEEDAQLIEQNRLLGAENIFFHKRIQILHEDVCDLKFSMKLVLEKLDSLIKKE